MKGNINKPPGSRGPAKPQPPRPQAIPPRPKPAAVPQKPAAAPPRPAAPKPTVPQRPSVTPRPNATPPRPAIVQRPAQQAAPRPTVVSRPMVGVINRPANPAINQARDVKREAVRQVLSQQQPRPRPSMRPAAPPQRVMPARPTQVKVGGPSPASVQQVMAQRGQAARSASFSVSAQRRTVAGAAAVAATAATAAAGLVALNVASAHPTISTSASSLQTSWSDLQDRSSFTRIQTDITNLDTTLANVMNLLESARSKGYIFQKDMEEIAYQAMDRWQGVRQQALDMMQQHTQTMQERLWPVNAEIQRLNVTINNPTMATSLIGATHTQVNTLLSEVSQIESSIRNSYSEVESAASQLNARLTPIHWALGQLAEAKFKYENGEDLVMAVAARWDQVGDDDPEGILYLSNKRLIFERKEKVATKKVLFVTVASQLVHEVIIDQPGSKIEAVTAQSKGLFGHQDFLEVQFAEPKLGKVSLHLNGQDSKKWTAWIESMRNGSIEDDRASSGGLSYADLTGPLTVADVMAMQNDFNTLQDAVMLKSVQEELTAIENDLGGMERKLSGLRGRGYVIEKSLEADITVLKAQWERIKTNTEKTVGQQTQLLNDQTEGLRQQVAQVAGMTGNLAAARPIFIQVKSGMASLQAQAEAATATVLAQYDDYADEVESLSAHLDWVEWMLDALDSATFKLLATESGVAAVEALWDRPGLEPENGILFLTDQRVLWEDRVGDFELKFEAPLSDVKEFQMTIDTEELQWLWFYLTSGDPYPHVRFNPGVPVGDEWLTMVSRARSGGYAEDRTVEIDPAEVDRIRNAPQQCSNCGAALTAPILRGQTEVQCEYCGAVIRI